MASHSLRSYGHARSLLRQVIDEHGGAVDPTRLRLVGRGGSHATFDAGWPELLIKLPCETLRDPARARVDIAPITFNGRQRSLVRHLGGKWCIPIWSFTVPLRIANNGDVWNGSGIVFMQQREPFLADPRRVRLQASYLEFSPRKRQRAAVDRAVFGDGPFDPADYLALNPEAGDCVRLAGTSPSFRRLLRQFLDRMRSYWRANDLIPDFAGADNFVAVPQRRSWSLRIGAVLKGDDGATFRNALRLFATRVPHPGALSRHSLAALLNGLATFRLLNVLALVTGGGRVTDFEISPAESKRLLQFDYAAALDAGTKG